MAICKKSSGLRMEICLIISAVFLLVSCDVLKASADDSSSTGASCPSLLRQGQSTWREKPNIVDVYLNESNVFCTQGEGCYDVISNLRNRSSSNSSYQLNVQENDVISVHFLLENDILNTSEVVVISRHPSNYTYRCETAEPMLRLWNGTEDVQLDHDIFEHGLNIFLVQLSMNDSSCDFAWRIDVNVKSEDCSRSREAALCSGKGYCADHKSMGQFSCSCCPGYVGRYCGERDACYGNPCQHGGFCVDIAEGIMGNTYQCLCPHGYRGRSCEGEVSLCDRKPCMNEGMCHGNQTHYTCLCPRGFSGVNCEKNINECLSNPCIHGVCEDGIGGYKCYCLPGYGGDHCEFEYDECDSNPCINGGACEDLVAGYRCHCGPGYRGRRCQVKVDLCTPNPCPPPAQCVDRGNNYTCICRPGYSIPGCTQHYDPCYPNPCQHGGTCWPSLDSYFCSCPPGYTGDLCEEALHASQPLPRKLEGPGEQETADDVIGHKDVLGDEEPVDHWHNVYLAGMMLTLAGTLVILGAIICHCKTHKTYLIFTRRLTRSCSDLKQQKIEDASKFSLNVRGSVSEAVPEMASGLEATSSVDVSENLDAPLIV